MSGSYDVCVLGGGGHVGAPLAITLAAAGVRTLVLDRNQDVLAALAAGRIPFLERGGDELLRVALKLGTIGFSSQAADCTGIPVIIITIGTPIDEYLNPVLRVVSDTIEELLPHLADSQTIVLRSTVAPGVTEYLHRFLQGKGRQCPIAFCPERVTQGNAIEEIRELPQLISGTSPEAVATARKLFEHIAPSVIEMTPREAEFAKLVTNAFRYVTFAAANQIYTIVETAGVDFNRLLSKMKQGYPRMASFPGAGFAAGPCLMKDTMQLLSFGQHLFSLGHEAMRINEGLPNFVVQRLSTEIDLTRAKVGILGMAFKGNSDDIRDSLAYKLRKILQFSGAEVLCTDEHYVDADFLPAEQVVALADALIVAAPHNAYRSLSIPSGKLVVDLWDVLPARRSDGPTA
jgi:UDP-N-acetyl-D-mannosaminuronic acid dehydrogenase